MPSVSLSSASSPAGLAGPPLGVPAGGAAGRSASASASASAWRGGGRLAARVWRGRPDDPRWARPALLVLLAATAVLYLWGLGASGWANAFYSAAAQAGTQSWKAFFYASSDAGNSITVDKPPAALWVMALSARLFGVNAWSILVPQALMGVATVGLLYAAVRRAYPPGAALLAGAACALTPVATLMFRFNNPDALLVLLLVAAAYATLRAVETAGTRWLVAAGVLVSFAFLTKMLQALLVVPALALCYLAAAPTRLTRRLWQLGAAGLGLVVPAGLFIAVVELVPESSRPYIGGSQNNSILELTLGYNGLGRLTGEEPGSVGGGPGGRWGETGWGRMFGSEVGGQISWLLPAALVLLVAGLWLTRRAPRTDRARAAFVVWGGWLLVTGAVFSQMQGIFHPYYTVALAPAVAALVGMGAAELWRRREHPAAAITLAATLAATAVWSYVLLDRTPDWHLWLRWTVLVAGLAAAVMLVLFAWLPDRARSAVAGTALVAALLGPLAYSLATAATPHGGSLPSAGPSGAGFGGGPGGRGGPGRPPMLMQAPPQNGLGAPDGRPDGPGGQGGRPDGTDGAGGGSTPPGATDGGTPPGLGADPGAAPDAGPGAEGPGATGSMPGGGRDGDAPGGGRTAGRGGGGMGGLLDARTPSEEVQALLKADADAYTWVAATVGSQNAAGYQLATGEPVMPIGGFNGSDPSPTLEQFQEYVAQGRIHYFIGGGGFRGQNGGSRESREIAAWVAENFTPTTVDGVTLYDLTADSTTTDSTATDPD